MRSFVLATVSAIALGLAVPVYAQGTTSPANPATATPSATAPANPSVPPAMPQTGNTGAESTQGAMGGGHYSTSPYTANSGTSSWHSGARHATRGNLRQAQEKLQAEGLYRGKIDGKDGPKTRAAIRQFQKKNGLPATARLDESTVNELAGGTSQNVGQGSSMPPSSVTNMTPPASSAAGTSGSSNIETGTTAGTSRK